ncbi:MAG: monovalent cation:proton antiporter-2 (CPA2) family protein [Xanthomonadales bacterium]|nr:monovalent cation:proton antiporter-2 (CPA2) family protein [Xanthomonadales bacterium]
MSDSLFVQAFIFLAAAVIAVPLARRWGLGAALGYLLAGVIIGPYLLGLVGQEGQDVLHFAEFGVVLMLFLIGLELEPRVLWTMRRPILGLGGAQVLLTTAVIAGIAVWLGLAGRTAVTVGMVLALSSTAMVLQTMNEKGWMRTEGGQAGFSVLLFQDIAVIPMLAILPFLADPGIAPLAEDAAHPPAGGQPRIVQTLLVLALVGGMILFGRYLARPAFRWIAETRTREIFIAAALLVVIGTTLMMEAIGLSPALGAFLAGVVLAESEYRHEIEAAIEPFKGLLLGVFFIAVGASIDLALVAGQPFVIAGLVLGLIVVKLLVMLLLGRLFRMSWANNYMAAFALAQGGEFAFLLFSFATRYRVMEPELANLLIAVVVLSMMATPLTLILYERYIQPLCLRSDAEEPEDEDIEPEPGGVIIAGYGRFGQIVARMLDATGIKTVLLDRDPGQIELTKRFGSKVFYGDASNVDLLKAAGAERARLLVVAINDQQDSVRLVETVKKNFPKLPILARARDRRHAYQLMNVDVDYVVRETFGSALMLGEEALTRLGWPPLRAHRIARTFMAHDEAGFKSLYELWGDDQAYGLRIKQNLADLEKVLADDEQTLEEHFEYVHATAPRPEDTPDGALLSEKEIEVQEHFQRMLRPDLEDDDRKDD